MNQPPPPIGFETPDSNDPRCKQPVVNNVEAEQMATLYAEAQMRKERNEAEYKQEVDKGQQADQKRQLTLSGIARAGQAERVTDEEKRKQERTKLDENRMKQKEEMENIKQEAEQKLMRIEANAKEARAAFEKKLEYDEANSRQRINALDQETKRLVAQQEAMNAENRRKRSEDRAARQAQHDREMAEKRKALAASREREEDYKKRIRELELEVTRTVQIMSLSINPSSPVLLPNSFLINPVPQSAIAHPAPSPENIKEIMDDIAEIDEMLRKECEKALENIPKYYKEFDNRTFSNYSEPIKNVLEDVTYLNSDSKTMLNELPNCSNLAPEKRTELFEYLKKSFEYYCQTFDTFKSSMQCNTHTGESAINQQQPEETRPVPSPENIKEIMGDIAEIDEMLRKECERALEYIRKYYENFDDRVSKSFSENALKSVTEGAVALYDKLSELKSIAGESELIETMSTDAKFLYADSTAMLNQLPNCSNLAPEERTKLFEYLKKSFEYYCQTFDTFKSSVQYNTHTGESAINQQQPEEAHPAPSPENIKEIMGDIAEIDEMLRKECERALEYIRKYYEKFDNKVSKSFSENTLKSMVEGTSKLHDKLSELKSIAGESEPIKNVFEDVQYLKGDSKEMLNQLPNCSNLAPEKRTKLFENLEKSFQFYCETFDEFKSSMQCNIHTGESAINQQQSEEAHPAPSLENIKEIMDDIAEIDEMLRKECERALKYISKYYENFDDRTFSNYSEYALKSIAERTVNLVDKLSELKSIIGESKPIKNVLEDVQYLKGDSKEMLNQLPNCSNLAPEKRTKLFENLKKSFEYYCQTFDEFKSSMQ